MSGLFIALQKIMPHAAPKLLNLQGLLQGHKGHLSTELLCLEGCPDHVSMTLASATSSTTHELPNRVRCAFDFGLDLHVALSPVEGQLGSIQKQQQSYE